MAALTSNNDYLRINGFTVATITAVPEPGPASLVLVGLGAMGLAIWRRKSSGNTNVPSRSASVLPSHASQ
jgi:hypothetical protein